MTLEAGAILGDMARWQVSFASFKEKLDSRSSDRTRNRFEPITFLLVFAFNLIVRLLLCFVNFRPDIRFGQNQGLK